MNLSQQIIFHNKNYYILSAEQELIVHPMIFNLVPLTEEQLSCNYTCSYSIRNYQLYLDRLTLVTPIGTDGRMELVRDTTQKKVLENKPINYSGAILIGCEPVKEYLFQNNSDPCFSYQYVYELVFNKGILETTVEHSRAMLRIRKNLELGLRRLTVKSDVRCIHHFMNSILIGDYRPFSSAKKKLKYFGELKEYYQSNEK